jgi:hypothetical protein
VLAFKTKFDQMWNDATPEVLSRVSSPPYFLDWNAACALEAACADYAVMHPNPLPMSINLARLEADHPLPPDLVWGQGPVFNNRLVHEINSELNYVHVVIYRLTVPSIADALIARHMAGVPVRVIIEPDEYLNLRWPEFWLTHAYIDRLWAHGIPIRRRAHQGLTHMKMLITSRHAAFGSSNFTAVWQRDHNYFVPATAKPAIHAAMRSRFDAMWQDAVGFADFAPGLPHAPILSGPAAAATNVPPSVALVWRRAPFAVAFDVYLGSSPATLAKVATVPAQLVNDPPAMYSWSPPQALTSGATYAWKVVSRTNAALENASTIRTFTVSTPGASPSPTPAPGVPPPPETSPSVPAPAPPLPPSSPPTSSSSPTPASPAPSAPAPSTPEVPPPAPAHRDAPQNVRAAVQGARVAISWEPPDTPTPPLSYLIEVGTATGRADMVLPIGSDARSFVRDGVPDGAYYVRVRAVTAAGATTASTELLVSVGTTTPVAPPANLGASVAGSQVTLSWSPGGDGAMPAVQYVLEVGFRPGASDLLLPVAERTSIRVDGVPSGVYYVRVRGVRGTSQSPASNETIVRVP